MRRARMGSPSSPPHPRPPRRRTPMSSSCATWPSSPSASCPARCAGQQALS